MVKRLSLIAAAALISASIGAAALAHNTPGEELNLPNPAETKLQNTSRETETWDTSKPSQAKLQKRVERLNATKLKVCQKREKKINDIMSRVASRGERQIEVFSTIAERTQDFYTTKGKTLANYSTLVADVNTKKAQALATLTELKTAKAEFKCDGSDPKGAASVFKEALQSEIASLKAYKTAVKNLIVGVKSLELEASDDDKE